MITVYIHLYLYKTHMISFVIIWKLNCWVIWWLFVYEKLKNNFQVINNSARSRAIRAEISFFSRLEEVNEKLWLLVDLGLFIHFLNNVFDEKRFLILEKLKLSIFFFLEVSACDLPRIFSQRKVIQVFTCVFKAFGRFCVLFLHIKLYDPSKVISALNS